MPYIIATVLFVIRTCIVFLFDKFLTPLKKNNKVIKQFLNEELLKYEKPKEGESVPFRLRAISYFMEEKDTAKVETLRSEMNAIVAKNDGKPMVLIFLSIAKLMFGWICFILTLIFAYNEPSVYTLIPLILLTVFLWVLLKRYVFIVLSLIVAFYIYRYLPSAATLYLSLVMLLEIAKFFYRKRLNKR